MPEQTIPVSRAAADHLRALMAEAAQAKQRLDEALTMLWKQVGGEGKAEFIGLEEEAIRVTTPDA